MYNAVPIQTDLQYFKSLGLRPGSGSQSMAKLDLRILEFFGKYTANGIWLDELTHHAGEDEQLTLEALQRLDQLVDRYCKLLKIALPTPLIREITVG